MGRAARERERAASAGARNSLGSKKQSKSRIVPLQQEDSKNPNAARHDIDGGTAGAVVKKTGWGPDSRKGADLETGESGNPLEDAKQAANVPVGVTDCVSAYSFTCSSIENFFNCCCPHRRHVPRVIYLVTVAIVFAGLLITLFIGVACQTEAREIALDSDVLVPAPAPSVTTTTRVPLADPYYRLTLEGGNYYSFAEISSPDCSLSVVSASSEMFPSGNFSAAASVDGDDTTCFQTPEMDMTAHGPTFIIYACDARTRSFTVDTANRCGFGPVSFYVIEWSWDASPNGTWRSLDNIPVPGQATTATVTTTTSVSDTTGLDSSSSSSTTERTDQRANIRTYSGPDCTGPSLWGVESMDMCYYEYPDGNFTRATGKTRSVEILSVGTWINTYETCLFEWDDDGPKYLESFSTPGCHNTAPTPGIGAIEVILQGSQLCAGGYAEGTAIIAAGVILLLLYAAAAACPLVYHAVFVAQCCIEKQKRKQIVFRD